MTYDGRTFIMTIKLTAAALSAAALCAGAASAEVLRYNTDVTPLNFRPADNPAQTAENGFDVAGTVRYAFDTISQILSIDVDVSGLLPDVVHVQHIHGPAGDARTPTLADDADGDGYIELLEGLGGYGPILLSIGSGIAEDGGVIFPLTDASGNLDFSMDYDLSGGGSPFLSDGFTVADLMPAALQNREYVVHGAFVPEDASLTVFAGQPDGVVGAYNPVLPVGAGEISAIPVPAAAWLMALGLGALGAVRSRRG